MAFAMFFLAEYANMILVSTLTVPCSSAAGCRRLDFRSAWFNSDPGLDLAGDQGPSFLFTMFLWVRATFPRYRYDQIMRLGWKVFIPVTLVWLVVRARGSSRLEHLG